MADIGELTLKVNVEALLQEAIADVIAKLYKEHKLMVRHIDIAWDGDNIAHVDTSTRFTASGIKKQESL